MANINLKDIVNDYQKRYVNKYCTLKTNYKPYAECTIVFNTTDLFHLFGMNKLSDLRANQWIDRVLSDSFTMEYVLAHAKKHEVMSRIRHYAFLDEIFYHHQVCRCVIEKDLKHNTMQLSMVFTKNNKRKVVVLGLRASKQGCFHPVTLHEHFGHRYAGLKQTFITSVQMTDKIVS